MVAASDLFDRVTVINMDRRGDRLTKFNDNISSFEWPLRCPERFSAVDGWKLPVPAGWPPSGMNGAYGCMLSHRGVLQQAIIDGIDSILVMEDDCYFRESFPGDFAKFNAALPDDWQFLFLGCQASGNTKKINEHVHEVKWANRWHCYGLRGPLIRDLYKHLCSSSGHCDLVTWPFLSAYKVYCPTVPLAAQEAGYSDISSNNQIRRWWADGDASTPCVYLRTSRDVVEELYKNKVLHGGYNRNAETGVDLWLEGLIAKHGLRGHEIENSVRGFINGIKGEASGEGHMLACLYAPALPPETCRKACGKAIIEIEATTAAEVMEQLGGRA